ncbi:MAG: TIGR04282 family arsenosugar biosynthesis glycosyltransferase [Pseudomonadota bacterium]
MHRTGAWRVGRAISPTLVVMVKEPGIGRVKTRLGRDIGGVAATGFYRSASRAVIRRLSAETRWRTILAVAPDPAVNTRAFTSGVARMLQGGGDLGDRLARATRAQVGRPVIVIGTDIPAIRPADISNAIRAARSGGAVFGPAPDGGYWLVGLRQTPRPLNPFGRVRWSTKYALADTERGLPNRCAPATAAARLRVLDDVDDGQTHDKVRAWSGRVVLPSHV